ncbi:MAG: hypothetical protein HY289_12940 [Planctomycetes bacterium]|nr:hypothetical protein [Planctomycetota bacterium]
MRAIMADNDIQGQMHILMLILESEAWRDVWIALKLSVRTFADLGLTTGVSDADLWHACQKEGIVLITGNRNEEGPDSLEATIQASNTPMSLPVVTLSDANKVIFSPAYAGQAAERILEYLMDIDNVRGTGRLWAP